MRFTPSPGTQGRTDKNLCRCFGAPARRVFPDHLITNILVHRCTWHAHITARLTWEQTAGGTVRTARSARDHTDTRAGSNGRRWPNGLRLLPGRPTASRNRVARGGTQGGPNCLTHALPRCLPTPTKEADGNGYGVITGRSDPPGPPSRASVNQVPLLLTGVRLHPPGRTDKNLCRCFGAPTTARPGLP